MNLRSIRLAGVVAAAGTLAAPAAADAVTRYVKPGGVTTGDCTSIGGACRYDRALNAGGPTQAGDTVVVLAGTYDVTAAPIAVAKSITVTGVALGDRPIITGDIDNAATFVLSSQAAGATVSNLDIRATGSYGGALFAHAKVTVRNAKISSTGSCVTLMGAGSTLEDTSAIHVGAANPVCIYATQPNTKLRAVTVIHQSSTGTGVYFGGPGSSADQLFVSSAGAAATIATTPGAARVTIRRGRFSGALLGLGANGGPVLVTDSFLRSTSAQGAAATAGYGADLQLRNVTAVSRGANSWAAVVQSGAKDAPANIALRNSIARGVTGGLMIAPGGPNPACIGMPPGGCVFDDYGPGTASIRHSNLNGASASAAVLGGVQGGDPKFVNPGIGDYRIAAGSPAIDAGADDPLNGSVDYFGNPRKAGAAVDLGAHERDQAAPVDQPLPDGAGVPDDPAPAAEGGGSGGGGGGGGGGGSGGGGGGGGTTDTTAPVLRNVAFTERVFAVGGAATPVSARAKRGSELIYTLSEPGIVEIAIQQRLAGKRKGKSCVKPTRQLRKSKNCARYARAGTLMRTSAGGPGSVAFSGRIGKKRLKPGRYQAIVMATDAAGNHSTPKTLAFTVVKR
jgi:hypothetical protein